MEMNQETVSIVVGPGGRINMITEEQANRLISSGQASMAHMSDDHLSIITGAQESLVGEEEDMSLQEQNMDAVCGDESLGAMNSPNMGPEVEMKLGTSAAGDVRNLLEESRGLGCLSSDDDIDINMAMGRDKQMESANEELRVIVHGDEGQNLDCIVDADGNKIDVAIETEQHQQGINAGDMVQVSTVTKLSSTRFTLL
jgi:hypothetical protein